MSKFLDVLFFGDSQHTTSCEKKYCVYSVLFAHLGSCAMLTATFMVRSLVNSFFDL